LDLCGRAPREGLQAKGTQDPNRLRAGRVPQRRLDPVRRYWIDEGADILTGEPPQAVLVVGSERHPLGGAKLELRQRLGRLRSQALDEGCVAVQSIEKAAQRFS